MPHLVHTKLFYDTISMNWRNWMMTKSGNWPASGWRNGFKRENQGNRFIVPLKTEGYDPYIDYLKGVSIFFVVLAHCLPMQNCLLFSLWGAQAVPLFLLIQTFHAYKKGVDKAVKLPDFKKLFNRILKPFIILLLFELFLLIVVFGNAPLSVIKSATRSGGIGPGSYYVWIYIQFACVIPIVAWIIKKLKKCYSGGVKYAYL